MDGNNGRPRHLENNEGAAGRIAEGDCEEDHCVITTKVKLQLEILWASRHVWGGEHGVLEMPRSRA